MIFLLQWEKITRNKNSKNCLLSDSVIFWSDIKIQIKINSYLGMGPVGLRTHYEFIVNEQSYKYNIFLSYVAGTNGNIPKIISDTHKLNIKALATKIEITEEPLEN